MVSLLAKTQPVMTTSDSPSLPVYFDRHVPDFRRRQGRRYPLSKLLTMITMAIMSGHYAYREIARFLQANQTELIEQLRLPRRGVPSHVTIRAVLQRVDLRAVNRAFEAWAAFHRSVESHQGVESAPWIAIDAKAIRSTVSDYETAYQDFACVVSAFSQEQGVLASEPYRNKAESEIVATRRLIGRLTEALGLRGACLTLDALHCKKRLSR